MKLYFKKGGLVDRPTISAAFIMKNEAHNIGPMLSSIKGCFDEIIMVDTGSTDNTLFFVDQVNKQIEAGSLVWEGLPEIKVYHFDWINDFAAARNFAFSKATKDYVFWMDLDDSLSDAKAFIEWRDYVLHSAHYWVALYNYAFDGEGKVACQFIRERVVKRNHGFRWEYPVHEGLIQKEGKKYWPQRVSTWWINHRRSAEDIKQDYMRNVKIMENLDLEKIHPRMKFYYGKELFENGFPEKAGKPLLEAAQAPELEIHDRLLTIQYAAQAAISQGAFPQALQLLWNGLQLVPSRAEYWCSVGDVYFHTGRIREAVHAYKSALLCEPDNYGGMVVVDSRAYIEHPHRKLAELFLTLGDWVKAEPHVDQLQAMKHPDSTELEKRLFHVKDLQEVRLDLPKTEDVIISCPPGTAGDWDEETLKEQGHGGSETAAIEVARWIKQKTKRRVKIFQERKARAVMASGVEYEPVSELNGYLKNVEPFAHIAWRHPVRLTKAKTYAWCHDLELRGANPCQVDKVIALSEFHKHYLKEVSLVPEDKIILGFNGIDPADFEQEATRDPLKVVFSSSPDRGIIQSIDIVKAAREISGKDIKLHCFYGVHNMRKMGMNEWADRIMKHIEDHKDFVVYHGNVQKKVLIKHFMEAAVWLYPADFIETYCITAIEAVCAGAYPLVRRMGALPYTLKDALQNGMATMLDIEAIEGDPATTGLWAHHLVECLLEKRWERVRIPAETKSWEKVADFFIKEMELDGHSISNPV
jgi:glycosyltransferase involved in cell wall biosynthesis